MHTRAPSRALCLQTLCTTSCLTQQAMCRCYSELVTYHGSISSQHGIARNKPFCELRTNQTESTFPPRTRQLWLRADARRGEFVGVAVPNRFVFFEFVCPWCCSLRPTNGKRSDRTLPVVDVSWDFDKITKRIKKQIFCFFTWNSEIMTVAQAKMPGSNW